MNKLSKILRFIKEENEKEPPINPVSDRIGSFAIFYGENPMGLKTIQRNRGHTEIFYCPLEETGRWFSHLYAITDKQHEELVRQLASLEEFKENIKVKGEV